MNSPVISSHRDQGDDDDDDDDDIVCYAGEDNVVTTNTVMMVKTILTRYPFHFAIATDPVVDHAVSVICCSGTPVFSCCLFPMVPCIKRVLLELSCKSSRGELLIIWE